MAAKEIAEVVRLHGLYLQGNPAGKRANLSGADLSTAGLSGANLSTADLSGADLFGADLFGADLSTADLSGANLSRANLSGADLSGANLSCANLSWANLTGADLSRAGLSRAGLSGANLTEANLTGANLTGANLTGANLTGANLSGAKSAEVAIARTVIVPDGDLVVWKKCAGDVLVKLLIPASARRSNAAGRKCRAEAAIVLAIEGAEVGHSLRDGGTAYRVGDTVRPHEWNPDRWQECAGGIHFFITKEEAAAYGG